MEKNWKNLYCSTISGLHDPFLLSGMNYATERIISAINNREKIVVYGFYDMDSITGISLLLLVLKYFNADVEYYIPEKNNENNEFNSKAISEYIKFLGTKLIITVGCGTKQISQIELCKKLGIDVVVTDNHNYKTINNNIINPNACNYPFKELSKTGVVFKLVHAIYNYYGLKHIYKYLDIVMLGTLASKVKIFEENAIIVKNGIYQMKVSNNNGIKALSKLHKIEKYDEVTVLKFINKIMPNNNLMGKVDNAKIAVELFTTNNEDRAIQIAKYLNKAMEKKEEIIC